MTDDREVRQRAFCYLAENSADLFFILNADGRISWANGGCERSFGRTIVGEGARPLLGGSAAVEELLATPEGETRERLITIGIPENPLSYFFTCTGLQDGFLIFGRIDVEELESARKKMFQLNQELNNLSRELHKKNAELNNALAHVKTLQGILPICMHCHKIRNDREIWDRLEAYIEHQTDAQFSHSVCPECLVEHYGIDPADEQE